MLREILNKKGKERASGLRDKLLEKGKNRRGIQISGSSYPSPQKMKGRRPLTQKLVVKGSKGTIAPAHATVYR
jgi:hypothetical protein